MDYLFLGLCELNCILLLIIFVLGWDIVFVCVVDYILDIYVVWNFWDCPF